MKLYYADASPYSRKCRVVAREVGLSGSVEEVATKVAPGTPNVAYGEVNPLRKVPALETDDGMALLDSDVICEYLADRGGDTHLYPAAGAERWKALNVSALAKGLMDAAVGLRYETAVRPEAHQWSVWKDDLRSKMDAGLAHFEAHPEAIAGPLTIGTVGLGCLLGYMDLRYADTGWRERFPSLASWWEALSARPSFEATKPA